MALIRIEYENTAAVIDGSITYALRGGLAHVELDGHVIHRHKWFDRDLCQMPCIADVIYNPPATVVKWEDGTKTVVKCQDGEEYDKMVGLAMCITKKALGNRKDYKADLKRWLE